LLIGSLGLTVCLLVIATANSVALIVVAWFAAQAFANAALAAYTATLPDQIPMAQRGTVSGLIGVMINVSILGAAYAAEFLGEDMLGLFMIPGLVGFALVALFAIVLPDKPLPQRPPSEGFKTVLKTFWVSPRKHPDFAFAWVSRFLVVLASFMFTTFRLLFLQSRYDLPVKEATAVMATGVLIYTVVLIVGAQVCGWLSDRLGRRKIFVFVSTLTFGIGAVLVMTAGSIGAFYVAEAVLGLGYGVYIAVDLALVADVLPNPDDSAKDLGVFNIANAGPQALAPAFGALLVSFGGGGNYDALLIGAAAICVVGAFAILGVKSVR
ncbi:MAG TPA: MFS transporter, partial [Amycolatopsis sp.]|nr:MFS transporter [Amycolatopsis sp.]